MDRTTWTMCLVGCLVLLSGSRGDVEVVCVHGQICILPCSFQGDQQITVHWSKVTSGELRVHTFYNGKDDLGWQDEHFKNRTSLSQDQISRRNASLLLMGVKIQDKGRYKCETSTDYDNQESFVNVTVVAPVGEVKIEKMGNVLRCSSVGIYPKPELTWTTNPPSSEILQNTTTVQQNEEQLYNISSSLVLPDNYTHLLHSCTVTSGTNNNTETWSQPKNKPDIGGTVGGTIEGTVGTTIEGTIGTTIEGTVGTTVGTTIEGTVGKIVGGTFGGIAILVVIFFILFRFRKRKFRKNQSENADINMNQLRSSQNGTSQQDGTLCGTEEEENKTLAVKVPLLLNPEGGSSVICVEGT